jgi:HEAT repeat protein
MNHNSSRLLLLLATTLWLAGVAIEGAAAIPRGGQTGDRLTPIQREIEQQRQRLGSIEVEERRDALMRLGNLKRPDASRVAAAGLKDLDPIVRVTAAHAVLSLPPAEAVGLLIPLLQDKSEFVRRETAYALGETRSHSAVGPLLNQLVDKEAGVRGAVAVALGQIGDEGAVSPLSQLVAGVQPTGKKKKAKGREDSFVMRAAARSLGQIRSRAGVSALIAALSNEVNDVDVRREAATSLGLIGDKSAESALRAAFAANDPYLSEAAREALRRLARAVN